MPEDGQNIELQRHLKQTAEESDHDQHDDLVTPTSLALSLSPPRAPPHYSLQRAVIAGRHLVSHLHLPHPHLTHYPDVADRITRRIGSSLPLSWQNRLRDSGTFRAIADSLVAASVPGMALSDPGAAWEYVALGRRNRTMRFSYGSHPMQVVDLYEPRQPETMAAGSHTSRSNGLVFFVHGGAWGSGMPWMYRLVATPFLEMGMAVAIAGYRTYPDADVTGQVADLERAATDLCRRRPDLVTRPDGREGQADNSAIESGTPWLGVCLCGHSSGAHVALLLLVEMVRKSMEMALVESQRRENGKESAGSRSMDANPGPHRKPHAVPSMQFDSFVGLSGVYAISHHFDYEGGRGVEEISPLKPACGHTREEFERNSPALRLARLLTCFPERDELCIDRFLPRLLLVHGAEDSTVPFTATADAASVLRSCGATQCDELYVGRTGHQDTVMHLMLGGKIRAGIVKWLLRGAGNGARLISASTSARDAGPENARTFITRSNL